MLSLHSSIAVLSIVHMQQYPIFSLEAVNTAHKATKDTRNEYV